MSIENRTFSEPIATVKAGECEGERCPYFSGMVCGVEVHLVDYPGKEDGKRIPSEDATSYALYAPLCVGEESRFTDVVAESPNGLMGELELDWRRRQFAAKHNFTLPDHRP